MLSFALMSTLDPMDALRDLVLLRSNLLMMRAMLSNNLTVTIGKVAHSKFVRIVLLVPVLVSADEVALEVVVVSEAALVAVEALEEVVEVLAAVSVVDAEALEAVMQEVLVVSILEHLQHPPTLSPTMLLLAPREARRSTFAT